MIRTAVAFLFLPFFFLLSITSCTEEKEHIAPAIHDRDSVSVMISYGVNTLVSDSGVIKYRIVTERWDVNTVRTPSRWTFLKGVFFEQFDEQFRVQAYVQADTAWYYDQLKLWELRGRVRVRNVSGVRFRSEELYWDGRRHELYSHKLSRLITPERTIRGTYFRSNESMTQYYVSNSVGSFLKSSMDTDTSPSSSVISPPYSDTIRTAPGTPFVTDSIPPLRPAAKPRASSSSSNTNNP